MCYFLNATINVKSQSLLVKIMVFFATCSERVIKGQALVVFRVPQCSENNQFRLFNLNKPLKLNTMGALITTLGRGLVIPVLVLNSQMDALIP